MNNQFPESEPTRPLGDDQDWFWRRPDDPATTSSTPSSAASYPADADATQQIPRLDETQQMPRVDGTQQFEQTQQFTSLGQDATAAGEPQSSSAQQAAGTQQAASGQWFASDPYRSQTTGQPQQDPTSGQPAAAWTQTGGQPTSSVPAAGAQQWVPTTTAAPRKKGGKLALVGLGTMAAVAAIVGPSIAQQSTPASAPAASSAAQPGTSQNGTSQSGTSQNQAGSQDQSGQSGTDQQSGTNAGSNTGQSGTGSQGNGFDPTQSGSGSQPAEQQPMSPWGGQQGSGATNEQSGGSSSSQQTTATSAQIAGVVLITTRTASGEAAGTGMVLTTNGYVLTNYHVVQSSTSIQVEVASTKKTYTATVVGHDATNDVALLKLSDASGLSTVKIDTDGLSSGQQVTAVGNSEGQGYLSAAAGSVTSLDSSITVTDETSSSGSEQLSNVIKTTAGAVPGDSGGPMYDAQGEVVGMTTAGEQSSSGARTQSVTVASYAVPISRAMKIVDQIEAGNESGTVKIGPNAYLGISVQTLQDGTLEVASVVQGGPAATAGIGQGDVITAVGSSSVSTHAQLAAALAEHNPGDRVSIAWTDAQGATHRATVTLGSSPVN